LINYIIALLVFLYMTLIASVGTHITVIISKKNILQ
jgi:hypothetical protein